MSETLVVQFFGICTHLDPVVLREHNVQGRRVLLVNASSQLRIDEFRELRDFRVGPHIARLQIARRDLLEPPPVTSTWMPLVEETEEFFIWDLRGVRMRVTNAIETQHAIGEALCIPRLAFYTGGAADPLPDLGPAAWEERPELTACSFDFPNSPLAGRSWLGATAGVLMVALSGPPILEVTAFEDRGQVSIPVRSGAHISLSNQEPGGATDADFLLHFLATEKIPPAATFPQEPSGCPQLISYNVPDTGVLSGPGCANSLYP